MYTVGVAVLSLAAAITPWVLWRRESSATPKVVEFGGRVQDEQSGMPLPFARVIVETSDPAPPESSYTDSNGNYLVVLRRSGNDNYAKLTVSAAGYHSYSRVIKLGEHPTAQVVLLGPESRGASNSVRTATLGPVPSGYGSGWSEWYSLCADAPQGFVIARVVDFSLEGDRRCGMWAECEPGQQSDQTTCWRFRLQGHNERPFPESLGLSTGKLTVKFLPGVPKHRTAQPLVYIQYHSVSEKSFADALRLELIEQGYRSPGVELVQKEYGSALRYYRSQDQGTAAKLQAIVTQFMRRKGVASQIPIQDFSSREFQVPPGQLEVWINLQQYDKR